MVVWSLTMVVVAVVVGLIVTGMPLTNPEICSLPLTAAACRPGCCMSLTSERTLCTKYFVYVECSLYTEKEEYKFMYSDRWNDGSLVSFRTVCICLIPVLQFCLFCYNTTTKTRKITPGQFSGSTVLRSDSSSSRTAGINTAVFY